jgi:hypothetical protein
MVRKALSVALIGTFCIASAQAQGNFEPQLPEKGTREISGSGTFNFRPSESYNLSGFYGSFSDDRVQMGAAVGVSKSGSTRNMNLALVGNLHVPKPHTRQLPFVGVLLGVNTQRTLGKNSNGTLIGLQGGIKHFVSDSVALTPTLQLTKPSKGRETFALNIGISFFLKN